MSIDKEEESKKKYKNLLKEKLSKPVQQTTNSLSNSNKTISSLNELADIRYLMTKRVGAPFCTNVLRVALNFHEEKVAR